MTIDFITNNYFDYIKYLRKLAYMPTVFSNPKDIEKAILFCKKTLETNLDNYKIYFDNEHNLIALPENINPQEDIVYLNAHIDTVNANLEEWDNPFHPWKIYEDEKEIVARGVSDCKAGVAYQLFLSFLARKNLISLKNLVFTITFKEEGAGKKTATEIAKRMGKKLPVSKQSTYLIVLENNVTVNIPPTLSIYAAERGNFVIKTIDFIPELQKYLKKLSHWNPVSIKPQTEIKNLVWQTQKQAGGHVCSVNRDNNLLAKIILEAKQNTILKAGDEKNFSVIPTEILISKMKNPKKHALVISNRSFDSMEQVCHQLHNIKYHALKDFSISAGFNEEKKFKQNKISKLLEDLKDESELKLENTYNIGGSDATVIYTSLDPKIQKNIFPIVMGPGSRSQRDKFPQRLTHGKNETFDKESGRKAIIFISKVLEKLYCI